MYDYINMKSQQDQGFQHCLSKAQALLAEEKYIECQQFLEANSFESQALQIEIDSIIAYAMIVQKKYHRALEILQQCLRRQPYHLQSKKRKALALQKVGDCQESLKEFRGCLLLQPESKSIKYKIKRLSMGSSKSESASSDGASLSEKMSKTQTEQNQHSLKQKVSSVKFGNFEVFQIEKEDSDVQYALIKEQINKLAEKKPKKSILKDSNSGLITKEKNKVENAYHSNKQVKVEQQSEEHNEEEEQQKKQGKSKFEKLVLVQSSHLKKKAKSVSFKSDVSLEDFN